MPHQFDSPFSRRNILLGGAALAAASALPGCGQGQDQNQAEDGGQDQAQDRIDYDWMNPMDNLEAYFKLTNSLKDRDWVHGWYSGLVFGMLPNNTPDALFGLEGFGLGYTVRQENGAFASFWKEVGFYKDLRTNEIIETWDNPYTGETNKVMHIHNRMVKGVFGPNFRSQAPVGDQTGEMFFKFPQLPRVRRPQQSLCPELADQRRSDFRMAGLPRRGAQPARPRGLGAGIDRRTPARL